MLHLHFLRVPAALVGARSAGLRAGVQLEVQRVGVAVPGPHEQTAGGLTDVRAVEVESNALAHHVSLIFGQAGVDADRADFGAFEAGVDTGEGCITIGPGRVWVCLQHPL